MLNPGWREIEPDIVALDACCLALLCKPLVDLRDALAFGTAGELFADGADVHVFEVAEYSAGFEQLEVSGDEFVDEGGWEVIEWESGDDEVERSGGLKLLEGQLVDGGLVPSFGPESFCEEALIEEADEIGVEFDEMQLVTGLEELEDTVGDGAGSRSDFEDVDGVLWGPCGKEACHGSSEEAAAGGDGARGFESFSELGEKRQVILEGAGHVCDSRGS